LLASHLLHEVEQVCDRVAIIRRGRMVVSGTVAELLRRDSYLEITVEQPERAATIIREVALPDVTKVVVEGERVVVTAPPQAGGALNRVLAAQDLFATALVPKTSSLEDVFLELTEPEAAVVGEAATPSPLPWKR